VAEVAVPVTSGPVILEEAAAGEGVPVATVILEEVVAAVRAAGAGVEALEVALEGEMGGVRQVQVVVAEQAVELRTLFHQAKWVPFRNRAHWPW
jgi:hypothetical protein